jgi:signal transduction histidine kinase
LSWTRKLLPRSLRSRLILSFGALIFLSLFLAGTTTVYLLRNEQVKTARERVGRLAEPIALRAAGLEARGATPQQIQTILQQEYGVRILLVDRDATVVGDTGQNLRGTTIAELRSQGLEARPLGPRFQVQRFRRGPDDLLLFTWPGDGASGGTTGAGIFVPGVGVLVPQYQPVVAVDQGDIGQAWRDLLPRLFLAGGVAFLVGVIAAGVLARSITRPLQQITSASEEMARGRYDQQIPSYGQSEVSRLADAFNGMARQVNRSHRTLREFLANVSHELKTPLTSIQGFSQAMVDGALSKPEDFAEAGRIINDEAVRMRGLVDDLLYLSQVEAGEIVMHFDRIDPNELLRATQERFARRAGQADVALRLEPSPSMPPIDADGRRMEQALANIVDNAVRHTPQGGRVTLRSSASNGHVEFVVHNTGSYIPPQALPRIFERFYQAESNGSRADGNTGLGLAITREIVEAHGGEVVASSAPERGTEFVITLPARREPVDDGV